MLKSQLPWLGHSYAVGNNAYLVLYAIDVICHSCGRLINLQSKLQGRIVCGDAHRTLPLVAFQVHQASQGKHESTC